MSNFLWDLMVFELSGNRLNDYGARVVAEEQLTGEDKGVIGQANTYTLLTDRLYTPTAGERFDSI